MKSLKKITCEKFALQAGLCFYCGQPMWLHDLDSFANEHGISKARAGCLQATAEHLLARCDGGSDVRDNLVAACRFCNSRRHRTRHALQPTRYRMRARSQLAKGAWHGLRLV